jgi:hypothetical protein
MTRTYDRDGFRIVREGSPLAATAFRLDEHRERQMPGTGSLVRDLLAKEGGRGE